MARSPGRACGRARPRSLHGTTLTHVAVEAVLRHRLGFYGLLASGWNFSDFASPWPRGRIPANADPSELIVDLLDAEHASGTRWSAAEFNGFVAGFFAAHGGAASSSITEQQLADVRAMLNGLLALESAFAGRIAGAGF